MFIEEDKKSDGAFTKFFKAAKKVIETVISFYMFFDLNLNMMYTLSMIILNEN